MWEQAPEELERAVGDGLSGEAAGEACGAVILGFEAEDCHQAPKRRYMQERRPVGIEGRYAAA